MKKTGYLYFPFHLTLIMLTGKIPGVFPESFWSLKFSGIVEESISIIFLVILIEAVTSIDFATPSTTLMMMFIGNVLLFGWTCSWRSKNK